MIRGRTQDEKSFIGYCGFIYPVTDIGYGEHYTVFPARSDCPKCKHEDKVARNVQENE